MSAMTQQQGKAPGTSWSDIPRWGWLALAAVVAFAVVAIALTRGGSDGGDARGAKDACQEFVKNRLKSPGTADFSSETATGDRVWTVRGAVDSQNGFGGVVRNTYNCRTTNIDGDWQLNNLEMSGT